MQISGWVYGMKDENPEPLFEPENRTRCPDQEDGKHEWVWDGEMGDWFCDNCGVWQEHQED
jgi:hypothetical protein